MSENATWTVEEINYSKGLDISFEVRDREGAVIVQTIMREKGEGWRDAIIAEDRKNVHLIAAAPDLLEAMKSVLPFLPIGFAATGRPGGAADRNSALIAARELAEAAIAKATA